MKYKIKFYTDYYDGPICGIVNYEGQLRYFNMSSCGMLLCDDSHPHSDDEKDWDREDYHEWWIPRMYKVYDLPKIEIYKMILSHWYWKTFIRSLVIRFPFSKIVRSLHGNREKYVKKRKKLCEYQVIGAFTWDEYSYNGE